MIKYTYRAYAEIVDRFLISSTLIQRLHKPLLSNSRYLLHRWHNIFLVLCNSISVSITVDDFVNVIDESCKILHNSDVEDSFSL